MTAARSSPSPHFVPAGAPAAHGLAVSRRSTSTTVAPSVTTTSEFRREAGESMQRERLGRRHVPVQRVRTRLQVLRLGVLLRLVDEGALAGDDARLLQGLADLRGAVVGVHGDDDGAGARAAVVGGVEVAVDGHPHQPGGDADDGDEDDGGDEQRPAPLAAARRVAHGHAAAASTGRRPGAATGRLTVHVAVRLVVVAEQEVVLVVVAVGQLVEVAVEHAVAVVRVGERAAVVVARTGRMPAGVGAGYRSAFA